MTIHNLYTEMAAILKKMATILNFQWSAIFFFPKQYLSQIWCLYHILIKIVILSAPLLFGRYIQTQAIMVPNSAINSSSVYFHFFFVNIDLIHVFV